MPPEITFSHVARLAMITCYSGFAVPGWPVTWSFSWSGLETLATWRCPGHPWSTRLNRLVASCKDIASCKDMASSWQESRGHWANASSLVLACQKILFSCQYYYYCYHYYCHHASMYRHQTFVSSAYWYKDELFGSCSQRVKVMIKCPIKCHFGGLLLRCLPVCNDGFYPSSSAVELLIQASIRTSHL